MEEGPSGTGAIERSGHRRGAGSPAASSAVSSAGFDRRLKTALVAVNLFVLLLACVVLWYVYLRTVEEAKTATQNLALTLEKHISGVFKKAEVALFAAGDEAERQLATAGIDAGSYSRFLAVQTERVPEVSAIRMADKTGRILFGKGVAKDSAVNIADRDYFVHARDDRSDGSYISSPYLSRISGEWTINISHRIAYRDGSFAGVVYAGFPTAFFTELFSSLDIGRSGTAALRDHELKLIARHPDPGKNGSFIGQQISQASFLDKARSGIEQWTQTELSDIDGFYRILSFRKIEGFPLYVSVGVASADYLAGWNNLGLVVVLLIAFFVAVTVRLSQLILVSWGKEKRAEEDLRESNRRLEEGISERTADLSRANDRLRMELEERVRIEKRIQNINTELEQRVRERTSLLESTNKELEAFAYSISHDLRSPLRALDGFSEVLLREYGEKMDGRGRELLERIQTASRRMGQLISDLLNLSTIARMGFARQEVDLSIIARETVEKLKAADPARKISVGIAPGLKAMGDERLIRFMMEHLIDNAWKFTGGQDDARVEIGSDRSGPQEEFFVRDNGVGFDMAYAGNLFKPFQRLHGIHEFPGNGIGLVTVQRIVARHGGTIRVEAEPGQGATFRFTLPHGPHGATSETCPG